MDEGRIGIAWRNAPRTQLARKSIFLKFETKVKTGGARAAAGSNSITRASEEGGAQSAASNTCSPCNFCSMHRPRPHATHSLARTLRA